MTVRSVAAEAGTSASAVYALFGSRDELVAAVSAEGFRRFAARLATVPVPTTLPPTSPPSVARTATSRSRTRTSTP